MFPVHQPIVVDDDEHLVDEASVPRVSGLYDTGNDGVELAEELLRIKPGIPVMLITGYGAKQIPTEKGLMSNKILFKPFGKSNLILAVGDAIHIWLMTRDAPLTSHACCGTIQDTRRNSA